MRHRARPGSAARRYLGLSALGSVVFVSACSNDFDTTRSPPPRGTLGEEMYGILCDRVGAQALHEDLTGASYLAMCHKASDGTYVDKVDVSRLPPLADGALGTDGKPLTIAEQQRQRDMQIARVETLARRRADLIAALDFTMPDIKVAVKDNKNADPTKSCGVPANSGERRFHDELSDMLGRFQALYNDGTIPQSTESLAHIMNAFKASPDAQAAYARFDARQGYRPIDLALGAARPIIAYPNLRDLANASLSLLSADSNPYDPDAKYDDQGNRIPVPGAAHDQFSKLLEVAHEELRDVKADPALANLAAPVKDPSGRYVLSRPRTNLEFMQELFYAQDPAFGGGTSRYITRRDARGYALIPLVNGAVPPPFVDKDGDKLADVDDLGRFITTDKSTPLSPFFAVGQTLGSRDMFGRALDSKGQLVYGYIDTSHTFTASLLSDLKPLVNANASQNHETVMYAMAGAYALLGARDGSDKSQRQYSPNPNLADDWKLTHDGPPPADITTAPVTVKYNAFHPESSALLDLVYAIGQVLGDKSADDTLALSKLLFTDHLGDVARLVGDGLYLKTQVADKHAEAKIPPKSVLWDEMIDVVVQIAKDPGLLEDVLRALGNDASLPLGNIFASYMKYNDRISYDRANLNGPAFNFAAGTATDMKTPVNRGAADTGANRSAMQKFLQAIHDTNGVTACNKQGAVVHARGVTLLGNVDIPSDSNIIIRTHYGSKMSFSECELFKIENLAKFYLDSIIGTANLYFRDSLVRNGICILGLCIGASTVDVIQQSSGLGLNGNDGGSDANLVGFWDASGSTTFRPKPPWLNRLVFFDLQNDTGNAITNRFLADLQGPNIGTSACPERIIDDPAPGSPDASNDGKVHGLRACNNGDWLFQRDQDATFVWEDFGFYKAITPLVSAFAAHKREDLFIGLMEVLHKHWADDKGSASECKLNGTTNCTKDGAVSYEPLLVEMFSSDVMTALNQLTKTLQATQVPHCTATDTTTHACTATAPIDGIAAVAQATRALVDPDAAKAIGLKDRAGNATGKRNDGTTNPQVTPLYLMLQALNAIDDQLAAYATANPTDNKRTAQWKTARSQLVDQFLDVSGQNTPMATFKNAAFPWITPVLIDLLRSQLTAHCPTSFTPPYARCTWSRDDVTKQMSNVVGGPTFAATLDLMDAIRKDDAARAQLQMLLAYLVDAASSNDALAGLLASAADLVQVLRDDANLIPIFHVLSEAAGASLVDANGHVVRKSLTDAQLALLARISGKAFDKNQVEICSTELDPNQILSVALQKLVTPMPGEGGKPTQTPLEVIMDVIADVNRNAPGAGDKLQAGDYGNIADNVSDFLLNKERGMEQFYEIVRQGTVR